MLRSTDRREGHFQCTLSGRTIPDDAAALLRAHHAGVLDGSLRPRLDLGRWFLQQKLVTA